MAPHWQESPHWQLPPAEAPQVLQHACTRIAQRSTTRLVGCRHTPAQPSTYPARARNTLKVCSKSNCKLLNIYWAPQASLPYCRYAQTYSAVPAAPGLAASSYLAPDAALLTQPARIKPTFLQEQLSSQVQPPAHSHFSPQGILEGTCSALQTGMHAQYNGVRHSC